MRFTLDSASEVSGDEQPSPTVVRKSLPRHTEQQNFASTCSTQTSTRKGILRHTSSYGSSTPGPQRRQRFQDEHDQDEIQQPQSSQRDLTPRRRSTQTSSPLPFQQQHQRRRSVTPAFELVGIASGSASPSTSRLDPTSRSAQRASASVPPWMRSSSSRTPRSNLNAYDLDSSDDENAALSSSEEDDIASDSDLDDAADDASNGSSSPQTSPYDHDSSTDSQEDAYPVSSRTRRPSPRKPTSVKLASITDDWEEWNRTSSQLAWQRARLSKRDPLTPAPRSRSTTAAPQSADLDEVEALLSSLNMRRVEEDAEVKRAFEARNKDLWSGIDASILAAETEARKVAAEEAARLEAARKSQEEAERKAAQARQLELDRIEAEKKAAAAESERIKQEALAQAELQKRSEAEQAKFAAMGGTGDDIRKAALSEYQGWTEKIQYIKSNILPVISSNPDLRKQCFAAKRQITPKVSQLTNSRQEIIRITTAIAGVLDAAKQASANTSDNGGGDVYTWILNHLSKCLIRQAEQEVAAKQDTAYPLARVVVWLLLLGHKELGEVLMARLCKKCPWVVPVWPSRKEMSEQEYRKVMGYKGEETTENYSNRMNGIVAFYFAILQTSPTPPPSTTATANVGTMELDRIPLHLRSTTLWRWCVRAITPSTATIAFLNHPMCPSTWAVFIEIAGTHALKLYGRQMKKVFQLLLEDGLKEKKAGWLKHDKPYVKAATVRLELLLSDWNEAGKEVVKGSTKGVEMES